jgi:SNF2 family DNA or RNA helicase
MNYQGKEIEILSKKSVFGKQIAEVKILSTGEVKSVPFSELSDEKKIPTDADIAFKAIAAKIKSEVFKQSMLAPIESNILPLPHQILALEKVMAGQFLRFLIADEVGMGKTIETGLILKELKLRSIVKRSLIIVPKSAMGQWQQEMKKHFNELFHIYDTDYINTVSKTFARLEVDN